MDPSANASPVLTVFTVGHSTHPIGPFIELLVKHQIAALVDVRSSPSSRRWPQFNQGELKDEVEKARIEYAWIKLLGGHRHRVRPDSPHTAWQSPGFRSYADYTESADFERGLEELGRRARAKPTAYMCAEGLWWRCHRRIISDVLAARGWRVMHILPDGKLAEHRLAPFARIVDGRVVYDGTPRDL